MGTYLDQLHRASFRGVEFKYTTGSTVGGRKIILHEFPNKTFRYPEDLGDNLRTFSITAIIDGASGEEWFANRAAFINALETEGIGILVHPYYGNVSCVCTEYTITDDDRDIGLTTFELSFAEANLNIFPRLVAEFKSFIGNLAKEAYDKVKNSLKNFVIREFYNTKDSGNQLKSFSARIGAASRIANASQKTKTEFNIKLKSFEDSAYRLPTKPDELGDKLPELINIFNDLPETSFDRDNINSKLFGFGEDSDSSSFTFSKEPSLTQSKKRVEDIEKETNRKIINGAINGLALVNLYENATLIDYLDDEQLNSKIADLEDKYETLAFGSNNIIDEDTLNTLQELRDSWRKFYENLRLTINKIIEVEIPKTSLKTIVYLYYGDLDNFDIIMQLNNIKNPALVSGKIKILAP